MVLTLEQEPWIERDFVPVQECDVLLLEALPLVVRLLIPEILPHSFDLGVTDREGRVALLPLEPRGSAGQLVDPFRGPRLDVADRIRQSDRGWDRGQQMDVIFNATDFDQVPIQAANRAAEVLVEPVSKLAMNGGLAIFGAEDDMVGEFGERSHDALLSPLSRLVLYCRHKSVGWRLGPLRPRLHADAAHAA